jgi:hypothetical protein
MYGAKLENISDTTKKRRAIAKLVAIKLGHYIYIY